MALVSRIHAFEWNDTEATPVFMRESIVELLGRGLRWGNIYVAVAPLFATLLERVKTREVLDMATGSGEPCSIVIRAFERTAIDPPRFTLSDLFPNVEAMKVIESRHPGKIEVVEKSVDATAVPAEVDRPVRTIWSAFHHLTPELAKRILADCVAKKRAVFVVEAFPRRLRRLPPVLVWCALSAIVNPFLAKKQRLLKLIFTIIPVIPLMGLWDAIVSVLRIHSEVDLRAMVADLDRSYVWEFHEIPYALGGRATVFLGLPGQGSPS
jgi:hypothetical protein